MTADAPTLRSFFAESLKQHKSRPSGDATVHFLRLFNGLRECRRSAIGTAVAPVARAIFGKASKFRQPAGLARKMSAIGFAIRRNDTSYVPFVRLNSRPLECAVNTKGRWRAADHSSSLVKPLIGHEIRRGIRGLLLQEMSKLSVRTDEMCMFRSRIEKRNSTVPFWFKKRDR